MASALLVSSCYTMPPRRPPPSHGAHAFIEPGEDVRAHLEKRFFEVTTDCGSATAPAFVCSGILIRGTAVSERYHAWDVNPTSAKWPGVSFSWLRKDAPHVRLAVRYDAGFILYPMKYAELHGFPIDPHVLCAFPIDGDTDTRANKGCGASSYFPADSGPCQAQGIATAAAWRAHFDRNQSPERYRNTCGFTVAEGTSQSAAIFMQVPIARSALNLAALDGNADELIIDGWPDDRNGSLPIEAFFYLTGTAEGKRKAQMVQADYRLVTGRWVAIIAITLPPQQSGNATFAYHPADQAIPGP